jgi:protein-disulfide isomerase
MRTVDSRTEAQTGPEGGAGTNRRNLLMGTAVVVGLAAVGGGIYYYLQPPPSILPARAADAPAPKADADVAELMKPGPLPEMALGDPKAPITVIEYASMTCPHCAHFSMTTFPELKTKYIDTGKVYFISREFPLDQLAAAGFILARCPQVSGGGPDKYFPLVETLFASQKDWVVRSPLDPMVAIAKQAGLTQEQFEGCLANQELIAGIEKVRTDGAQKFGVQSTPTFFINGKLLSGDLPLSDMEKQFAPYLKGS